MSGKNLPLKLGLVLVLALVSIWAYFDFDPAFERKGLPQGIDLAGGSILTFQVDKSIDMRDAIGTLKQRIDPNGLAGLEWIPMKSNRFQVRMPAASKLSKESRQKYFDARDKLLAINLERSEIRQVQAAAAAQRQALIKKITGEAPVDKVDEKTGKKVENQASRLLRLVGLSDLITEANKKLIEIKSTKAADDEAIKKLQADIQAQENVVAKYSSSYRKLLSEIDANNVNPLRLQSMFNLFDEARIEENKSKRDDFLRLFADDVEKFKEHYPAYAKSVDEAIEAYRAWAKVRRDLEDPSDLKRMIKKAGVLTFRIAVLPGQSNTPYTLTQESIAKLEDQLEKDGAEIMANEPFTWYPIRDQKRGEKRDPAAGYIVKRHHGKRYVLLANSPGYRLVHDDAEVGEWGLANAWPGSDSMGAPAIHFEFDSAGSKLFGELTGQNINRPMVILLDGKAQSIANIKELISQRGIISGNFTYNEAVELARVLKAGRLKGNVLGPVAESTFGPAIGADNLEKGQRAAIIGLVAVAIFMMLYYIKCGAIADFALLLNMILIVGAMCLFESPLTLPGIAGLILTIGMAVDANVLIFERLREEQAKGLAVKQAIKNAYERALSAIFDANLTTLLVCLFLYIVFKYVGMEQVRGFAVTLGLGVMFSMFTALVVTRWLFETMGNLGMLKKPLPMLSLIPTLKVNWIGKRKKFWVVSAVMLAIGLGSLIYQGKDVFGIEFSAGTQVIVKLKDDALVNGKLPSDGLMREVFAEKAKATKNDKLINAKVTKVIDEKRVEKFLGAFGENVNEITLAQWNGLKRNKEFFKLVDTNKDDKLSKDELEAKLPETSYEVLTTEAEANKVRTLIDGAFGDMMQRRRPCDFGKMVDGKASNRISMAGDAGATEIATMLTKKGSVGLIKIDDKGLTRINSNTLKSVTASYYDDLSEFDNGALLIVNNVNPPLDVNSLKVRINDMRMQPDYGALAINKFRVIGMKPAGDDKFSSFIVLVNPADAETTKKDQGFKAFAFKESKLLEEALKTEDSLVMQSFDAQHADTTTWIAIVAVVLSWAAIVIYLWLRFGSVQWGIAAVVCLVHDVIIVIGMVAATGWIAGTGLGDALGIGSFKIDLAMIAAILTVIGYSVNDSIVVFDRIRENRGKLKTVSVKCINDSINQTLPRTLLTSFTTFLVVAIMYIWGGQGIRAFNYALIVGIIFGTYSSIAVASPLLLGFKHALMKKTIADEDVVVTIDEEDEQA